MNDLAEFHDELRAVARELLAKAPVGGPAWSELAGAGWLGLEVAEALGGAGATFAEVAVVLDERGRAETAGPYLGSAVLAAGALDLAAPHPDRDALARRLSAGEAVVAVAVADGDRADDLDVATRPPFRIAQVDGVTRMSGRASLVADAPGADHLLLLAADAGDRPVLVGCAPATAGLDVVDQPLLDASRPFGLITADGVEVIPDQVWSFAGDARHSAQGLLDRGALAVTIDGIGISQAMLDATVAYAQVRQQFGRPIGSFQAVKHICADMAVQVAVSRQLVDAAVDALAADPRSASAEVSMAKSCAGSAAVDIAGAAMQLHGGIGYTWESGIHAALKRAALDRSLFGSPRAHRRRLAARYR